MAAPFDKSGIIEFFLIEAGEHIQNLNKGLLSLEKDPTNSGMIDELFRAAHTLKGSAAMMGFQGISDVAHKAEDMLGQFRSGSRPRSAKETLNFLFDSVDAITPGRRRVVKQARRSASRRKHFAVIQGRC